MNKKLIRVTGSAVMTALIIVIQLVTAPLGLQYVTGPLVNYVLIVNSIIFGLPSGIAVACVSPAAAFLFGIGSSFPLLIPFIMLGNISLVIVWRVYNVGGDKAVFKFIAPSSAASVKCLVLYLGIVRVAVPFILNLNENQAAAVSSMFSINQFLTAILGGLLALLTLPTLLKASGSIFSERSDKN